MLEQLTVRCRPKNGESLLSYLLRLANSNAIPINTFINSFKYKGREYWIQKAEYDLLCLFPNRIFDVDKLIMSVRISKEDVEKCSFHHLLKHFSRKENLANLRILSGFIRDTLHFCPMCLKENKYYKLLWKVKDVDICLAHECKLTNCCPHCNNIIFYKHLKKTALCPYCTKTLEESITAVPTLGETQFQHWYQSQWIFLMEENKQYIPLDELSLRILYTLNGERIDELSKDLIKNLLDLPGGAEKLLQHARGTLINSETLHISFLLKILNVLNSSFEQLFSVDIPESFHKAITEKNKPSRQVVAGETDIPKTGIKRKEEKINLVKKVLKEFIANNEQITLKNVKVKLGVSSGTIRYWGCNDIIAQYKKLQKEIQQEQKNALIRSQVEELFSRGIENLDAQYVYSCLGINRTILWRTAPDITAYIHDELKKSKRGEPK